MTDYARICKAYLKIREARTALKHQYEEEDLKLKKQLERLDAVLLSGLNETKTDTVTIKGVATFYKQEELTPTGSDWDLFYKWVAENDAFDALEKRIKKTFIKEYMDEHDGGIPPGVSVYREWCVRVRRSK